MEDLLASIRKAIHEDIGEMQASATGADSAASTPASASSRPGEELSAAATEIQQLREKISKARASRAAQPVEPIQRAASLAAALQADSPRRNWRDLEPTPLPRGLRGSVLESEPVRSHPRPEPAAPRQTPRNEPAILSGTSAHAVQSSFSKLADVARAPSERQVEEMTRDMLRSLLKQWLDDHLPAMVERLVREEIERVARTGR